MLPDPPLCSSRGVPAGRLTPDGFLTARRLASEKVAACEREVEAWPRSCPAAGVARGQRPDGGPAAAAAAAAGRELVAFVLKGKDRNNDPLFTFA